MLGIRCQGEDAGCQWCLNSDCGCPNHITDTERPERIRQSKNLRRRIRHDRSVYHMDDPQAGDEYEFSAITTD